MPIPELHWLPEIPNWRGRLKSLAAGDPCLWDQCVALANGRINFVLTNALDERLRSLLQRPPASLDSPPFRLAVLGSSTLTHLLPAIRVGGLRRGLWVETYENAYGQYWQELGDRSSPLYAFEPGAVLLSMDAHHLASRVDVSMSSASANAALHETLERIRSVWRHIREGLRCPILHQATVQVHNPLLGENEHRLAGSRAWFVETLNSRLRALAEEEGVDLLAVDRHVARDGLRAWHDPGLWRRTKQEITPTMAPFYGDLVGRWIGAAQGRSRKCLVLDLDNTLWGGVIGDDGIEGIELGQGSPLGESYVAFQQYALELSRRGIILAVCSKNDAAVALEPFEKHPEMILRRADIACFIANWSDKAANLRAVAEQLNIGLESLVFVDDNPFERNLVRQELPMVAVPEVSDDPADYPGTLADAGYFEGVRITEEDRSRTSLYRGNYDRDQLQASTTDLASYLRSLEMQLVWKRFDRMGLMRISQLMNRSNQFNLTTRRYSEDELLAVMNDSRAFGLQLRLVDRFGDNGIIAIVIGRLSPELDLEIDSWLMSCRVLGREVEATTLNLIALEAKNLGARRLVGTYIPTRKNAMVRDHYQRLGFDVIETTADGHVRAVLDVATYQLVDTPIRVSGGQE